MKIRLEGPGDTGAIRQVITDAFGPVEYSDGREGSIVDALRSSRALSLSLVAEEREVLMGHAAFSPVSIAGVSDWFGLGPVAVHPEHQRRGIGAALIGEGLGRLRSNGANGCVVFGDPAYYQRFGFRRGTSLHFEGGPPEYFMAMSWQASMPSGAVTYAEAFGA